MLFSILTFVCHDCRPQNLYKEIQIRLVEINIAKRISFLISCTKFSLNNLRGMQIYIYGGTVVIITGLRVGNYLQSRAIVIKLMYR